MKVNNLKQRLESDDLYHACNLEVLSFETIGELKCLAETIGQERALEAIEFGVGMPHEGFNLYVMGSSGLGRHTLVNQALITQVSEFIAPSPSGRGLG